MSEPFVEKTQKELGAIITVPKLTDKLLSRPPFRFLHDIVISFMKATSFPEGLFPEEMLDSSNASDKDKKILFLSLLISAVEAATGKQVSAQPSKIVAGQEAEKTNEFLQLLASCAALSADKKAAAVRMVKGGAPAPASTAPASTAPAATAPTKDRGSRGTEPSASTAVTQKTEESKDEKDRREEERRKRKEEEKREAEEKKKRKKETEAAAVTATATETQQKQQRQQQQKQQQLEEDKLVATRSNSSEKRGPKSDEATSLRVDGVKKDDDDDSRKKRKESEDGSPKADTEERRKRHDDKRKREKELAAGVGGATGKEEAVPLDDSSNFITRATRTESHPSTSAGKAPPRTKPTHEVVEGGTAGHTVVAGVIRESKRPVGRTSGCAVTADDGDTSDWMRVVEQQEAKPAASAAGGDTAALEGEARGYLGQQALRAKREQEEAARRAKEASGRTHAAEGSTGIVIHGTRGGRSGAVMAEGELNKLREQLQLLTKASNPLGKLLETIYDDIDTMARELEMWRSEARSQALAATDARRQTTESLQEVHAQLQNLEDTINDQILKTHNIRRNVINNDNAIAGMVRMIVNPDMGKR